MSLQITPVTPSDPTSFDQYLAAAAVLHKHETPAFPPTTRKQLSSMFEHPWPGNVQERYVASAEGEVVGYVSVEHYTEDNPDMANLDLGVLPEHRRRGHGRELLAFAEERARDLGKKTVNTHSMWTLPELDLVAPDEDGPAFARAMGYRDALPEVNRVLDLSTVDESVLDGMLEHARAKADGYRLIRWNDPTPDDIVHDIAYLDGRLLADAPMGDTGWEPMNVDAERVRKTEAAIIARGRTSYHTGMVHSDTGRVVAWTTITADDEFDWHAWQQITIVDPDHRGHRLGALVKVENLRWFREQNPKVTAIDTFNAAENGYMIAINEQMGFRPQYAFQNWRKDF
ncbi:MAG: GNAT family N-acetyltransferase [Hamadaea sp.]|uniref:GNAT family N-acetyltransferase n=1 Tax=Hamadaea sp. TaxID=2024425 RepID=UPI0018494579|nr:GNAT family N-acetyltransferase [Hamadaea sp.]NUR73043.1 GNAT family N-acetyltransferase [Hamadaea sp.]NUT20367.1 GNAT family N-acetyltransferase [Hamadaea sp.]